MVSYLETFLKASPAQVPACLRESDQAGRKGGASFGLGFGQEKDQAHYDQFS